MTEKKWSNYWGKYRSEDIPRSVPQKTSRPTITISPKIPRISAPKFSSGLNINSLFMVILALGILGLGLWQFKSAKTIQVLSNEKTDLSCQLGNCTEQLNSVNTTLVTCASNLGMCNSDLTKKISALNTCESQKTGVDKDYKLCRDDLLQIRRDYSNLEDDYDECTDSLDSKNSDLSNCRSDYDEMKSGYQSLCNSHCSQACTFNSDNNRYTCATTTTTTPTTTTTT